MCNVCGTHNSTKSNTKFVLAQNNLSDRTDLYRNMNDRGENNTRVDGHRRLRSKFTTAWRWATTQTK